MVMLEGKCNLKNIEVNSQNQERKTPVETIYWW